MMWQSSDAARPSLLSTAVAGLVVVWTLYISLSYLTTPLTMLYEGVTRGRWFIGTGDFRAALVVQLVLSLAVAVICLWWVVHTVLAFRRGLNWQAGRGMILLAAIVIGFFLLVGVHQWFETMVCERIGVSTECGFEN